MLYQNVWLPALKRYDCNMNYQHNPSVVVTDLDDELVLLDPNSKQMFSLNAVGRVVWLDLPKLGLERTLEQITQTFDVTPEQAHADALELINNLVQGNLLEVKRSEAR
jgi:Coenzyme PQQ synthesis protein D (PqqD)